MNHDSELVQPGPAEPELTEEPQGNQPLPVLPGQLCQMPGLLPCQWGGVTLNVWDPGSPSLHCLWCCMVGNVAGLLGICVGSTLLTLLTGLLLLLGLSLIESWPWAASFLITRFSKRPLPFLCFACSRFPRQGAATAWNSPVRF